MYLKDLVLHNIGEYPNLFKDKDYQASKLKVYNHLFLVRGNGYKWAVSKNGQKGYLTQPKFNKIRGEYIKKADLPYGKHKFKIPSEEELFNNIFVCVTKRDMTKVEFAMPIREHRSSRDLYHGSISKMPDIYKIYLPDDYIEIIPDRSEHTIKILAEYGCEFDTNGEYIISIENNISDKLIPYDIENELLNDIDWKYIQQDWLSGIEETYQWLSEYVKTNLPMQQDIIHKYNFKDFIQRKAGIKDYCQLINLNIDDVVFTGDLDKDYEMFQRATRKRLIPKNIKKVEEILQKVQQYKS